jgi:microsomal dipeptidase-like Zn-dependent dipeptidase
VTHAMQDPFFMTVEDMKRCVEMGAIVEHCYYSTIIGPYSPLPRARGRKQVTMDEFAETIKELGAQNCFISTDLGQALTPIPAEGLKDFIAELMKRGISKEQIALVAAKNPARLLGLEPF